MSSSRLARHQSSSGDDASSVYSGVSVTSSYRHHNTGPFMPHPASPPQPVLTADAKHVPKTTGSTGIMIVGLGGANGTTLLAGILANRLQLNWHGAKGEAMSCNYYGCITQLEQKGGGVGYRNRVRGLADASMAAVGGWVSFLYGRFCCCCWFGILQSFIETTTLLPCL
jgi:Myo-inositol-1-phosphate synthase